MARRKRKKDSSQGFGGTWTVQKLKILKQYLSAYATIMSKKNFRFAYIDAFAGTGYRTLKASKTDATLMFPELGERESEQFLHGSARIALEVQPRFEKYIFVEKSAGRASELETLKETFSDRAKDIAIVIQNANTYLQDLCANHSWTKHRAVLFLDPFGMQVEWDTIKAIARTEAIDLWLLFPVGAINRLLRRDGKLDAAWRRRLDKVFGERGWLNSFYRKSRQTSLFGGEGLEKQAPFERIQEYLQGRLRTLFPGVAKNPTVLRNSKNVPLFLLCFAAGNKRGANVAVKIAEDILGKIVE